MTKHPTTDIFLCKVVNSHISLKIWMINREHTNIAIAIAYDKVLKFFKRSRHFILGKIYFPSKVCVGKFLPPKLIWCPPSIMRYLLCPACQSKSMAAPTTYIFNIYKIIKCWDFLILILNNIFFIFFYFFLPCSLFPPVISSFTIYLGMNITTVSNSPIWQELCYVKSCLQSPFLQIIGCC